VTAPLRGPLDSAALRARMPQLLDRQFREMRVRECLLFDAGDHVELVSTGAEEAVLLAWADLLLDRPVRPQRADRDDILALLSRHEETLRALDQLELGDDADRAGHGEALVLRALDDADSPVVRLVNSTLHDAMQNGASDVHMESHPGGMTLRYRLDGVLSKVGEVPGVETAEQMVSRIKVLAELDIAERRIPQDGRFRVKIQGRPIDFRVSTCPIIYGEKVVMRILDQGNLMLNLEDLGFEPHIKQKLESSILRPYGMCLITGPTGSGKSTTLYSALARINDPTKNISTIEDPVEYNLPGINQVNAKPDVGLTFPAALKSFLRQDPDIIMVGEIRDLETGSIAIKAALTGHMVLSTLHTNDCAGTIQRMINMGIDDFLITAALNMIEAQRLARRVCKNCRSEYKPEKAELLSLGVKAENIDPNQVLYKGKGCETCRGTGYKGRVGLYEVLVMDDRIRDSVMEGLPTNQLKRVAIEQGMESMRMAAIKKVLGGATTTEQALELTIED